MKEKLVLDNIGLIYKCIKDLNCQWETEDEFQTYYDVSLEGLIKGAKKYNSNISDSSGYLYKCIKSHILREFRLSQCDCRKVNKLHKLYLNDYVWEDKTFTYEEIIPDPNVNVEKEVETKIMIQFIIKFLNCLCNEKDKTIIKKYYGICGEKQKNAPEIAKELGVTKTEIYRRRNKALQILRKII